MKEEIFMLGELNSMQFIGPLVLLIICIYFVGFIYSNIFSWLPKDVYKMLIGPVTLLGAYIWYVPMNMGFYELFK
jgi:hypothetical protein